MCYRGVTGVRKSGVGRNAPKLSKIHFGGVTTENFFGVLTRAVTTRKIVGAGWPTRRNDRKRFSSANKATLTEGHSIQSRL